MFLATKTSHFKLNRQILIARPHIQHIHRIVTDTIGRFRSDGNNILNQHRIYIIDKNIIIISLPLSFEKREVHDYPFSIFQQIIRQTTAIRREKCLLTIQLDIWLTPVFYDHIAHRIGKRNVSAIVIIVTRRQPAQCHNT